MLQYSNSKYRCQCKNKNNLICNNKQKIFLIINNKRVCTYHLKYLYETTIIKIQSAYRSYISRKKLNYFYKNLPDDIQYLIKYYINKDLYEKKKLNIIENIINKKISKFISEILDLFNSNIIDIDKFLLYENKILQNLNLFSKYNILIYKSIKKQFNFIDLSIYNYIKYIQYYHQYNSIDKNELQYKKIRLDIIIGMLNYYYSNKYHYSEC